MSDKNPTLAVEANEAALNPQSFFEKNKKTLLIALAACVVLVGACFAYKYLYQEPREEKASTLLAKGQIYFDSNDYEKALKGDNAGFLGYLKIASEYSGTDAGNLANLYAGLSYAHSGNTKEAIKFLEAFSPADDDMISPAAISALANCYASNGQVDKAIDKLKEAAKKADNNSLSPLFLLQAGQLLETQNKAAEAKALYEDIKNTYSRSVIAQDIDKYIERASK